MHNILHDRSAEILKSLYKSASFVVQAICFQQTGLYFKRQTDLIEAVSNEERAVIHTFTALKNGAEVDFDPMSEKLLLWSKRWIEKT